MILQPHKATPVLQLMGNGSQMKQNKENVCVSAGCLSKQELGGVSELTFEGKDFPKPLCKTTADPGSWQRDTGCCGSAMSAFKTHWLPPLYLSSSCVPSKARRQNPAKPYAVDITLPIWSVWNVAMLYCIWTDTFVMSDTTTDTWEGLANTSPIPTREQELNCLQYDMAVHDWFCTVHAFMIHSDDILLRIVQH